jgi:hypothetical protein
MFTPFFKLSCTSMCSLAFHLLNLVTFFPVRCVRTPNMTRSYVSVCIQNSLLALCESTIKYMPSVQGSQIAVVCVFQLFLPTFCPHLKTRPRPLGGERSKRSDPRQRPSEKDYCHAEKSESRCCALSYAPPAVFIYQTTSTCGRPSHREGISLRRVLSGRHRK